MSTAAAAAAAAVAAAVVGYTVVVDVVPVPARGRPSARKTRQKITYYNFNIWFAHYIKQRHVCLFLFWSKLRLHIETGL